MAPTKKHGTAESGNGKAEAPPSPQAAQAHASLAMQLAQMLAGMAHELAGGQATPERQAEICRVTSDAAGAILGWSVERIRRMAVVRAVALTIALDLDQTDLGAIRSVRKGAAWAIVDSPSDAAITNAVQAWRRDGDARKDSKTPLVWPAMADLVRECGLGTVQPDGLRVDWSKWKSLLAERV